MIRTEQLLKAALDLSDSDRLFLVEKLLESLPAEEGETSLDDADLLNELDRRFSSRDGLVPAEDLWAAD